MKTELPKRLVHQQVTEDEDGTSDSEHLESEPQEPTNPPLDCDSKSSKDVSVQTDSTLELSPQKSILINRDTEDVTVLKPQSLRNSVTISQSSESAIFKFFKTRGKNENVATAETFIYMAIPPDGGYAWLILGVAFVCQAIVDGIVFSIGILLPSIASELSLSYKQTALVASTQIGIQNSKRSSDVSEVKRYEISHDPLGRDDIFYDGPPDYDQSVSKSDLKKSEVFSEKEDKIRRTVNYSLSMIRRPSQALVEEDKYSWIPAKIRTAFYALFDLQLLKLAEFRLLLLDALFFPMGFNIPFIYCTERAQIDENYAELLPVVIGLTNVIFRVSMGFVAYKIKFHTAYLSGSGMILGGFVTLLSGFIGQNNEVFQFLFALSFGIAAASYSALRAMIYVKVLGLERLTNAFGLTTMVMGIGVFMGTNIAGVLNDLFSSYWASFVFSGTCMTISGILKLYIPKYVEYRKEIDAKKDQRKVRFAKESHKKRWWQKCLS